MEVEITTSHTQLEALANVARALRAREVDANLLSQTVASSSELLAALPPVYERAMSQLVTRLESSALFGGESCSFSHTDLYDALDQWVEKARGKLST